MKSIIVLTVLLFVAISSQVEVTVVDPENSIDSKYIALFNKGLIPDQRHHFLNGLAKAFEVFNETVPSTINKVFSIGEFNAFSATLSPKGLQHLKGSNLIQVIEQQYVMRISQACNVQSGATWGIDRIGEQALFLDGKFEYDASGGAGVDQYVIDTGILISHRDFGGRAIWGMNFAEDDEDTDCNGHGTHVAGTMGGTTYGIAKKSTLWAVKVLGCSGSGTNEGVIAGIEWAANKAIQRKKPSVANMSLGGSKSTILNAAITDAVDTGLTFVVAAGNENTDSCTKSPASSPDAITVGATGLDSDSKNNQIDIRAYFSNYGTCNTIYAPGVGITSTWIGSNTAINTISGTSMASPHVAGIVALHIGTGASSDPVDVKNWLIGNSVAGEVFFDCDGAISPSKCQQTKDRMVYSPCE